jgi:hypothetical protein
MSDDRWTRGVVQSTKTVKVGESFLRREQCIVVEILELNTMIHKGSLSMSIYCSSSGSSARGHRGVLGG